MSEITATQVNELRQRTGAGLMECKKALLESNGDAEKAIEILRKKGIANAAKKAGREASEGLIHAYIHGNGRIGVLLELNCETDFVAKNSEFKQLAHDISMHIAAASPAYVRREEAPLELVEKEKEIASAQVEGKPAQAIEKIVEGKLNKWYGEVCLMEQKYVKNPDQTIEEFIKAAVVKLGENIVIRRFARYQIGG